MNWNAPMDGSGDSVWTKSGVKNWFQYELVPYNNLNASAGFLDCITGGRLTEAYRSDYRRSLSLDYDIAGHDRDPFPLGNLIRVHHHASYMGMSFHEVMGTFIIDKPSSSYMYGRQKGTLTLYSTLYGLAKYVKSGNKAYAAGSNVVTDMRTLVESNAMQHFKVMDDVDTARTWKKTHTWKSSTTLLSECHDRADAVDGHLTVDDYGFIVLERYVNPTQKSPSFWVPYGSDSVTLLGVGIAQNDIVNGVVVSYEHNEKMYSQYSKVDSSHPWYPTKIGRYASEDYSPSLSFDQDATADAIKKNLKSKADSHLKTVSDYLHTYSVEMLYIPIATGNVGRFRYRDSMSDTGMDKKVLLSSREIELNGTMKMNCTFEEIGEWAS